MDIKRLLKPKAIAIVGANEKNGSFGNYSALNALQNSDDVHVYFVNAKKDFVLGRKAYKSLSDLPEVPDSIMLVTPKASIPGLMEEAGQLGVGGVIIVAAGYSEEGTEEGRADEEVIVDIAKKYDMAVMGPNCTGYVNNVDKVKMWGMGGTEFNMAERGTGIAFFAQSGTMAIHALSCNYVDISYVFSMGNSVMLSIEDLMEYAVEDPEVNMFCLYLEGVRHGRRFMNVLKRARELGKPVVIHASGMSKKRRHRGSVTYWQSRQQPQYIKQSARNTALSLLRASTNFSAPRMYSAHGTVICRRADASPQSTAPAEKTRCVQTSESCTTFRCLIFSLRP